MNTYIPGLWIDDIRIPPSYFKVGESFVAWDWVKDVNSAKYYIEKAERNIAYMIISIDHDAGDFGPPDYIKVLDWLEETGRSYPIRIHSQNPVGVQNMRTIIRRNGWKEVF